MKKSSQYGSAISAMMIIAVLIAGGALVGCSGASQDHPAVGTPAATTADSARSGAVAKSDSAQRRQASRPLPAGYPNDVAPVYEPSTVTHAFKMGSGRSLKYMIVAETGDSVDVVATSLADDFRSRGAKVSKTPLNEEGVGQVVASNAGYGTTSINYDVHKQRGGR